MKAYPKSFLSNFWGAVLMTGCFLFQGISPASGNQSAAYAGSDSRHMGERASRSVRKNRSRVRTASIATRRRFYAERAQPAAAPSAKS